MNLFVLLLTMFFAFIFILYLDEYVLDFFIFLKYRKIFTIVLLNWYLRIVI